MPRTHLLTVLCILIIAASTGCDDRSGQRVFNDLMSSDAADSDAVSSDASDAVSSDAPGTDAPPTQDIIDTGAPEDLIDIDGVGEDTTRPDGGDVLDTIDPSDTLDVADAPDVGGCLGDCDCPQGEICTASGDCIAGVNPRYCCDNPGCPQGEACTDSAGNAGVCLGCETDCDCQQGEACLVSGECITSAEPRYCCDASGCPAGEVCTDGGGAAGTCPVCDIDCDCPQGLGCVDGECIAGIVPIYCCDNPGCQEGEACSDSAGSAGVCPATAECATIQESDSVLGCRFLAVDLDNSDAPVYSGQSCFGGTGCRPGEFCEVGSQTCARPSADAEPWAILVTNPDASRSASLSITYEGGVLLEALAAGESRVIELPSDAGPETPGVTREGVFDVTSDVPVAMQQINSASSGSFSNDATQLLPTHALGREYWVPGWPSGAQVGVENNYVDVVAGFDDTLVTITSPTAASPNIDAGTPVVLGLARGELLHVTSDEDLSGMHITSNHPVAVFVGQRCGQVPVGAAYCDHLEEQLPPLTHWGQTYHAVKSPPRGTEEDVWRILAANDGTTVTLTPDPGGASPLILNAGERYEVASDASFSVTASADVMVTQFIASSQAPGIPKTCSFSCIDDTDCPSGVTCNAGGVCEQSCSSDADCEAILAGGVCDGATCAWTGLGDPAFAYLSPAEQASDEDVWLLLPSGYRSQSLSVVTEDTSVVRVNGVDVTQPPYSAVGAALGAGVVVFQFEVSEGAQRISSTGSLRVLAHGYACDVSYAMSGGYSAGGDACAVDCDCPQGLRCGAANRCVEEAGSPSFCCTQRGCPEGDACTDDAGAPGVCPTPPECLNSCDCPDGEGCTLGGTCEVGVGEPCCQSSMCPEGDACVQADGSPGTCPAFDPNSCVTDTDCVNSRGSGWQCDSNSSLCYQPGSCDSTDSTIAPCRAPNVCGGGGFGNSCNCTDTAGSTDCRSGETCIEFFPGMPSCI